MQKFKEFEFNVGNVNGNSPDNCHCFNITNVDGAPLFTISFRDANEAEAARVSLDKAIECTRHRLPSDRGRRCVLGASSARGAVGVYGTENQMTEQDDLPINPRCDRCDGYGSLNNNEPCPKCLGSGLRNTDHDIPAKPRRSGTVVEEWRRRRRS
jgi:hypothetical protein